MSGKAFVSLGLLPKTLASRLLLLIVLLSIAPFSFGETIRVDRAAQQRVRLGIDAERLWYWNPSNAKALARVAVGELQAEYARVAMVPAYEREAGVINAHAYDKTLSLMASLKAENPQIKFFATPQPISEAYTT
jgi:hypothetical protein